MKRTTLNRGTPLRRTPMHPRKTPMPRGTVELKRTGSLKRVAFAKPVGKNDYEKELDRARPALHQRSKGLCEVRLPGCQGNAVHPHHRKRRSQGGTNELRNLLHLCPNCHTWAHANVALSVSLGIIVPRWMPVGPVEEVFAAVRKFTLTDRYGRA